MAERSPPAGDTPPRVRPPVAAKRPRETELHGHTRVDEYDWLRDDTRSDPQVLSYLREENTYFDRIMEPLAGLREALFEEITSRLDPEESSVPYCKSGYWYYSRYEAGREYPVYARRRGSMDAAEEILLDCNLRAGDAAFYQLGGLEVSDDHRYVAIAEDTTGNHVCDIAIFDTRRARFLPERIANADSSMAWSADGRYLFYLHKDAETLLACRLMRHQLGADSSADVLVYEETDKTFFNGVERSRSGEFILLVHHSTDTTEMQLLAAGDPLGSFEPFLPRQAGHEYDVDHAAGGFFIRTNWGARNFRVMTCGRQDSADREAWKEVVPHREDAMVLGVQAFDRWLALEERVAGLRKVRVLAHDGSLDRYLDSGEEAPVMWLAANVSTAADSVRYGVSSLVTPNRVCEVDLPGGASRLLKAERVLGGFASQNYRSRRMLIAARDGARVPVTLAWHRDTALDGRAPALIYAYGAYGISTDPWFRSAIVSLLDRGFVYVIAHVRGGQEMGRAWYDGGRLMNKKNTFTDFVDVTRGLQQQALIDPARSYAMGGSAGGLLMGVVANSAPELYHGVIAAVPFVDVVSTMLDESLPLTTGEYRQWGDPANREECEYMLSYSPYDQVREQAYPNMMVTTGLHDSLVQYFEPVKWVARLRDRRTDSNRLILRINMDAGHHGASGRYRRLRETADEFAFLVSLAEAGRGP